MREVFRGRFAGHDWWVSRNNEVACLFPNEKDCRWYHHMGADEAVRFMAAKGTWIVPQEMVEVLPDPDRVRHEGLQKYEAAPHRWEARNPGANDRWCRHCGYGPEHGIHDVDEVLDRLARRVRALEVEVVPRLAETVATMQRKLDQAHEAIGAYSKGLPGIYLRLHGVEDALTSLDSRVRGEVGELQERISPPEKEAHLQ